MTEAAKAKHGLKIHVAQCDKCRRAKRVSDLCRDGKPLLDEALLLSRWLKLPNAAGEPRVLPSLQVGGKALPWSVIHPDAGDVGLRAPRFASKAEADAHATKWNRDYPGHTVVGPYKETP